MDGRNTCSVCVRSPLQLSVQVIMPLSNSFKSYMASISRVSQDADWEADLRADGEFEVYDTTGAEGVLVLPLNVVKDALVKSVEWAADHEGAVVSIGRQRMIDRAGMMHEHRMDLIRKARLDVASQVQKLSALVAEFYPAGATELGEEVEPVYLKKSVITDKGVFVATIGGERVLEIASMAGFATWNDWSAKFVQATWAGSLKVAKDVPAEQVEAVQEVLAILRRDNEIEIAKAVKAHVIRRFAEISMYRRAIDRLEIDAGAGLRKDLEAVEVFVSEPPQVPLA